LLVSSSQSKAIDDRNILGCHDSMEDQHQSEQATRTPTNQDPKQAQQRSESSPSQIWVASSSLQAQHCSMVGWPLEARIPTQQQQQ
jgi:hypothetical protein